MVIYVLTDNVTSKKYVGITIVKFQRRWRQHITSPCGLIGAAIKENGEDNFNKEIIETCSSLEELKLREQYWIKELNTLSPNGYNLREGGTNNGGFTQEVRDKIKESWVERKKVGVSDETRAKMSKSHKELMKNNNELKEDRIKNLSKSWTDNDCKERRKKTHRENFLKGLHKSMKGHYGGIPVICLNNGIEYPSAKDAGRQLSVDNSDISKICRGILKQTKGFRFKYKD